MSAPVIYRCAECNQVVIREGEKLMRLCGHKDKPVAADLSATAYSVGGMAHNAGGSAR